MSESDSQSDNREEFTREFTRHQRNIYVFIRSLVSNASDADELWQQTNLALWRKYDSFQPGSNFRAWAQKVAFFEITNHYARKREASNFDASVLEALASEVEKRSLHYEHRLEALRMCIDKLRPHDRELIEAKYATNPTAKDLGQRFGRSAKAIYKALARIRTALLECVQRRLTQEATP